MVDCEMKGRVHDLVIALLQGSIDEYRTKLAKDNDILHDVHAGLNQPEEYHERLQTVEEVRRVNRLLQEAQAYLESFQRLSRDCNDLVVMKGSLVEVNNHDGTLEVYLIADTGSAASLTDGTRKERKFVLDGKIIYSVMPSGLIGKALLGHSIGETVAVQTPIGTRILTIKSIA